MLLTENSSLLLLKFFHVLVAKFSLDKAKLLAKSVSLGILIDEKTAVLCDLDIKCNELCEDCYIVLSYFYVFFFRKKS